jgi:hypothetical protein
LAEELLLHYLCNPETEPAAPKKRKIILIFECSFSLNFAQ